MLTNIDRPGTYDPFMQLRRLQSDMNRLFESPRTGSQAARAYPPVNVWRGDESVVVTAELPGLSQDDLDLTIREDTLTISAERKFEGYDNQVAWHRRERTYGSFTRTIELPFRVDPDTVDARFTNGVLAVEMQRPEADRPRKIAVKGS